MGKALRLLIILLVAFPCYGQNVVPIFFQTSVNSAPMAATPTFSPAAGTYLGSTSVTISTTTSGATICYTTDGTTPTAVTPGTCTTGTTYSSAITVSATETINAIATETGYQNSSVGSATYTITPAPAIKQSALSTTDGTYTATLPSHTAGGMTCVFAVLNTTTAPTIANTAGWSWGTPASYSADAGAITYSMWAWCTATLADSSSDTATVTSGASHGGIAFVDISDTSAIDSSAGTGAATYSAITTGTITMTGTADLVCGMERNGGGGGTNPSGYTSLTAAGTGYWGQDAYNAITCQALTGSSTSITMGAANGWDAFGVAIK